MLTEEFVSTVSGPPITANTAVSKEIGIYTQTLSPSFSVKSTFKKSSCPRHGLAVSDTHVFAAQDQKAHVHVYSRTRGNQEALVSFNERIRSLALAGSVLLVGTTEGRLFLWETRTGRQVATPPCHVQAVYCIAATPFHVLTASDDSNVNVWSLARLLEFDSKAELEPEAVLSNHRGAITDLAVGPGTNSHTSICVSASRDKTCIVWNYQTGQILRTLLFPSAPLCVALDPGARAAVVAAEGGSLFLAEFFGRTPLLGSQAEDPASIVVQVGEPIGAADEEAGETQCLATSYDGTTLLTGHAKGKILKWTLAPGAHPTELANLNASVTNLSFTPVLPDEKRLVPGTLVKPNHNQRQYVVSAQLRQDLPRQTRFDRMLNAQGFPDDILEEAITALSPSEMPHDENLLSRIASKYRAQQKADLVSSLGAAHAG